MSAVTVSTTTDLVERALSRDQAAWDALVERFTRLVWHVVLGFHQLDPDTQADVHQTTWLRLAENLATISDPERLGSWLATTARRECIRLLDSQARQTPTHHLEPGVSDEPLDRHLLEAERDAELWRAFRRLGEPCQQLLRLLLADPPFSYDEISELLDMKRGSIGPTRGRCLEELRMKLGAISKAGGL